MYPFNGNMIWKLYISENEVETFKEYINEILKQVDSKWALVSKETGKVLAYYDGEGKPSDEWVKKQEKRINYFKHKGD